jgi:uncharacterized protein involved in tolerance to divalent cations
MLLLITGFPNDGRKLKNFIVGLLKSGIVKCVKRINYTKSYFISEWKVIKEDQKILLILLPESHKEKVVWYFKKNHPQELPEMIRIQPSDVHQEYLERIQSWL